MKRLDLELLMVAVILIGTLIAGGKVMYDLQKIQPIMRQVIHDIVVSK